MEHEENSWQVVGKNKQKIVSSSNQRRKLVDSMPKVKSNDPIKDTSTMFDAFIKKPEEQTNPVQVTKDTIVTSSARSKHKPTDKKKLNIPVSPAKTKPKLSLDEAISKIDKEKLSSTYTDSQKHFPHSPVVWLKDTASMLHLFMESVPDPDPAYKGRGPGYPLSSLNDDCRAFLTDIVSTSPSDVLIHMYGYLVKLITTEMNQGHSCHGYRIFLQCVAQVHPDIKIDQFIEIAKSSHTKPQQALAIIWCIGQCGLKDSTRALKLWVDVLLPLVTIKYLSSYIVLYLEHSLRGKLTQLYGVLSVKEFFLIFDLIFSNSCDIAPDLKVRLTNIYSKIKQIIIRDDPAKVQHLIFPGLLTRTVPSCSGTYKSELLSWIIQCLEQDPDTFSVWRQMYTKRMPQSAVILGYIKKSGTDIKRRLGESVLMTTIQSFNVTNDNLLAKGHKDPETSGCSRLCKNLLKKKETSKMSWFWMLPLVIGMVGAIIAYDIITAESFYLSRTLRFLNEYGILSFLKQVYILSRQYTFLLASWLRVNIPQHASTIYTKINPYFLLSVEKCKEALLYVEVSTQAQRTWLAHSIIGLYYRVYDWAPEFWAILGVYGWMCVDTCRSWLIVFLEYLTTYTYTLLLSLESIIGSELGTVDNKLAHVQAAFHGSLLYIKQWYNTVISSWTK